MNDIIPTDYKPRSFWERKEGVTGQIVGVALIGGAGVLLYRALPYIITLLENTLIASLLGMAAVALFFVITDKRFWRLGAWAYMSAMRRLTQVFVEIDPIGIMKNYIEDLKKKLADMNGRISRLSGMIRACKEEIRQNDQAKSGALGLVSEAKKKGLTMVAAAQSRKAGRMAEANLSYQDLLARMELLHRVLVKYQEVSTFLIEDMAQEVSIKERKRAMAKEAYSAMKSAMAVIHGDPSAKELYDMANEYVAADYAMRIGEIEDFVRMSDTFMQSIDLRNGVYEQQAVELLADWEKNADSIVLGDAKRLLIENHPEGVARETRGGPARPRNTGNDAPGLDWFGQAGQ
jgi:TolA-binding protein